MEFQRSQELSPSIRRVFQVINCAQERRFHTIRIDSTQFVDESAGPHHLDANLPDNLGGIWLMLLVTTTTLSIPASEASRNTRAAEMT